MRYITAWELAIQIHVQLRREENCVEDTSAHILQKSKTTKQKTKNQKKKQNK